MVRCMPGALAGHHAAQSSMQAYPRSPRQRTPRAANSKPPAAGRWRRRWGSSPGTAAATRPTHASSLQEVTQLRASKRPGWRRRKVPLTLSCCRAASAFRTCFGMAVGRIERLSERCCCPALEKLYSLAASLAESVYVVLELQDGDDPLPQPGARLQLQVRRPPARCRCPLPACRFVPASSLHLVASTQSLPPRVNTGHGDAAASAPASGRQPAGGRV